MSAFNDLAAARPVPTHTAATSAVLLAVGVASCIRCLNIPARWRHWRASVASPVEIMPQLDFLVCYLSTHIENHSFLLNVINYNFSDKITFV